MNIENLTQWIESQGVYVSEGQKKERLVVLAEKTWDAIGSNTLNISEKRRHLGSSSVTVPKVREDFWKMTKKKLIQWIESKGIFVKSHQTNEDNVALAGRTWDAIESGTPDDMKEGPQGEESADTP